MTAIVGIYRLDGKTVTPFELQRMTDRLAHRGPDGAGAWHDGAIGLGHCMLWTTPESLHERLPLVSNDGLRVITADARIDNRDELLAAFGLTSAPPDHRPDSALILASYERWGESCVDHLLGDFAFAIWDNNRQHLFCARDHMGVKPFFYFHSDDVFAFASEIKALFCLPEVPKRVNEEHIASFLASEDTDRRRTAYADVCRLPAAHVLTVRTNELRFHHYWSLDPSRELSLASDEEYAQQFHDIFMEAVRCRLRSAYPVGSHLSGGLDSSSVVCAVRKARKQQSDEDTALHTPLHTFSAIFDDVPESDERSYINTVLAQGDIEPHYVRADRIGTLSDIERMLWHEEEPFEIPNLFISWELSRAASDVGVRVLFDGESGDTVLSHARGWLVEFARTGKWGTLLTELNARAQVTNKSRYQLVIYGLVLPLLRSRIPKIWRRIRKDPITSSNLAFIAAPFAKRMRLEDQIETNRLQESARSRPREQHFASLNIAFVQDIFEVLDREAAAFSLEFRHPFYDRRLVEFCLALPVEQKLRHGYTRYVLRNALASCLPDDIRRRGSKANLSPNFDRSFLLFDRARIESLYQDTPATNAYVNLARVRAAYNDCQNGRTSVTFMLWKVAVLASWLKQTRGVALKENNCFDFDAN